MLLNMALRKPPREPAQVEDWLSRVVEKVRMKVMREPWAGWDDTPGNEGVTGDVILTTSHCSIHIWNNAEPPYAKADLYSCAEFEPGEFLEMIREFEPYWFEYAVVDRTDFGFRQLARGSVQAIPVEDLLSPEHRAALRTPNADREQADLWLEAVRELNRLHQIYGLRSPK
jgi:S-adenosylmethionine/arginine decarboxylase-like enzyme